MIAIRREGYALRECTNPNPVAILPLVCVLHIKTQATLVSATLYVITGIKKLPRLGLIRIDDFDHFLVDA